MAAALGPASGRQRPAGCSMVLEGRNSVCWFQSDAAPVAAAHHSGVSWHCAGVFVLNIPFFGSIPAAEQLYHPVLTFGGLIIAGFVLVAMSPLALDAPFVKP